MKIQLTFLFVIFICVTTQIRADKSEPEWPQHFDCKTETGYYLVSLWENGTSVFLSRVTHEDGSVYLHFDKFAKWGYLNKNKEPIRHKGPNIWVKTNMFRIDYHKEYCKLIEIDKTGIERVLSRVENTSRSSLLKKKVSNK